MAVGKFPFRVRDCFGYRNSPLAFAQLLFKVRIISSWLIDSNI